MTGSLLSRQPSRHDEEHPLNQLKKEMEIRVGQRLRVETLMEKFTQRLYEAFEKSIADATASGIPGFGKPRRIPHPAGDWRQALQIFIEDWSVIVVPLIGAAWPNPRDEARIPTVKFKEECGRIAMFLGDDPNGEAFYDFLIFSDGSWFAWGFGWPRVADDIEQTHFDTMSSELLTNFVKDIHVTWRPRRLLAEGPLLGTTLSASLDAKKRVYTFGLPGEE
jgi:hypothetical protein